jgi:hypothetical protein
MPDASPADPLAGEGAFPVAGGSGADAEILRDGSEPDGGGVAPPPAGVPVVAVVPGPAPAGGACGGEDRVALLPVGAVVSA